MENDRVHRNNLLRFAKLTKKMIGDGPSARRYSPYFSIDPGIRISYAPQLRSLINQGLRVFYFMKNRGKKG